MEDLLWTTYALSAKRSIRWRGPIWCWVCLDGGIYYSQGQLSRIYAIVRNLDRMDFGGDLLVGPLWGSVTLSGPVVLTRLSHSTPEEWKSSSAMHSFVLELPKSKGEVRAPVFDPDYDCVE